MSHSDANDSGKGREAPPPQDPQTRAAEVVKEADRAVRGHSSARISSGERERMIDESRTIEFPSALRGYDRAAVDHYVERVNRLLAEMEISSSPEAAVRHALDEVSEETREILQHAHDTAEEITSRSRSRADDRLQQAEHEARELREAARREAEETLQAARTEANQLREAAARETTESRDAAAHDAKQIRDAATSESQELRDAAAHESQELRDVAARESQELRDAAAHESQELRDGAARDASQLRAAAQRETDELRSTARREADELLEAAEARARDLARNAETVWRERRRLIEDMRGVGEQLVAIGEAEAKRFSHFTEEVLLEAEPDHPPAAAVTTSTNTAQP